MCLCGSNKWLWFGVCSRHRPRTATGLRARTDRRRKHRRRRDRRVPVVTPPTAVHPPRNIRMWVPSWHWRLLPLHLSPTFMCGQCMTIYASVLARSYPFSPDSPFSLISSLTLSNHLLLDISPSPLFFHSHRSPSYVVFLSSHHLPVPHQPPFLDVLWYLPLFIYFCLLNILFRTILNVHWRLGVGVIDNAYSAAQLL